MASASDHIVCVTGAGAGIGAATARRFAEEGARVIAADYQGDRLEETRVGYEDRMRAVSLDLRNSDAVFAAIAGLPASSANASAAKHASVCANRIRVNSAALEANAGLFRSTARTVAATTAQI